MKIKGIGRSVNRARRVIILSVFLVVIIASLITGQYRIMYKSNINNASQTSHFLLNQVERIISDNESREEILSEKMKEDYITRANAVAYIIMRYPNAEKSIDELFRIARLLKVDEIHLFNTEGVIYGGTVPEYYNLSMDSGEQIGYFKPMLTNKALSMCQDATLNTAENKEMMYAMVWSVDRTKLVQVGIEPVRYIEESQDREIKKLIESMPAYEGIQIITADKESGRVVGTNNPEIMDSSMDEIGLKVPEDEEITEYFGNVDGKYSYCAVKAYEDYYINVVIDSSTVNKGLEQAILISLSYLVVAASILVFVVNTMEKRVDREEEKATTDSVTGLNNRLAYEEFIKDIRKHAPPNDFHYLMIDINGLKTVNDNIGHAAGDELIKGTADCMKKVLSRYGNLYRIGGDEFVAILNLTMEEAERAEEELNKAVDGWSGRTVGSLSVSLGQASAWEFPGRTFDEISKIAEERMYAAKSRYYKMTGKSRRQ